MDNNSVPLYLHHALSYSLHSNADKNILERAGRLALTALVCWWPFGAYSVSIADAQKYVDKFGSESTYAGQKLHQTLKERNVKLVENTTSLPSVRPENIPAAKKDTYKAEPQPPKHITPTQLPPGYSDVASARLGSKSFHPPVFSLPEAIVERNKKPVVSATELDKQSRQKINNFLKKITDGSDIDLENKYDSEAMANSIGPMRKLGTALSERSNYEGNLKRANEQLSKIEQQKRVRFALDGFSKQDRYEKYIKPKADWEQTRQDLIERIAQSDQTIEADSKLCQRMFDMLATKPTERVEEVLKRADKIYRSEHAEPAVQAYKHMVQRQQDN